MTTRRRPSGVTVMVAAVLVLLPALAWLQYSWLNQIADADRERRARTLQTAAAQLAQDVDSELGRAVFALQLEPSTVEQRNWSAFASKYQVWADAATSPRLVQGVYFVEAPGPEQPKPDAPELLAWNPQAHTFAPTGWPPELAAIRARFDHDMAMFEVSARRDGDRGARGERAERGARGAFQRLLFPSTPEGHAHTVMTPIMRISPPPQDGDRRDGPPNVRLLGFTIVRFDLAALSEEVLPALVRRHLYGEDGQSEYSVAVVARDDPNRVIFESHEGAAAIATARPDVTAGLLGARMGPFMFMARGDAGRWSAVGQSPPPPPPAEARERRDVVVNLIEAERNGDGRVVSMQRATISSEGQWRLVATHRAGSLEAAVAAARTRNFALSSGILALLAAAIGLIVVSARRADRLARQQLEFVAAVSHELRTPVSVINAAAGNLADGVVGEPARVKHYGSTIQSQARRLGETVERVLQLAGIAAGRAAASPTVVPGQRLIDEALAATQHEIDAAGVTVERRLPDALPSVEGDALALRSALQNLIGNAVKYAGDARWVRVSAAIHGRRLQILVEDRGLGIGADDRKHIFEPFYRGREAVARQIQGSGLGLHLVRRIVEAHGGSVTVESEAGQGSTFIMELPVAADRTSDAGAHALSPHPSR